MSKEKIKIEIRNRWNDKLIFAFESIDNIIKNTVLKAIKSGADLRDANLCGADLSGANLSGAKINKIKHLYQIIPEEGTFIAWKKAEGYVLKLEIHASAKRTCNIKNRKCRALKVRTLEIQNIDGTKANIKECKGIYDSNTIYRLNKVTYPDRYDDDFLQDCTSGIHFFITRQEAVN